MHDSLAPRIGVHLVSSGLLAYKADFQIQQLDYPSTQMSLSRPIRSSSAVHSNLSSLQHEPHMPYAST